MGAKTKIEWTRGADGSPGATWTPIRARNTKTGKVGWHCAHVTPGCENCYSERLNLRLGTGLPFKPGHLANGDVEMFLDEVMLIQPLRWKRPRMIFVCSMTDLFADFVPDEWIDRVFAVMALASQHTFQVLTKRSARMREYMSADRDGREIAERLAEFYVADPSVATRWPLTAERAIAASHWPLPNVWLGVSAEDQARADERIPDLLATPAAVRFVSYEPALGPIDFRSIPKMLGGGTLDVDALTGMETMTPARRDPCRGSRLDWIIAGGESGAGARASDPEWFRSARAQCEAAGVAFFMKQITRGGEKIPQLDWPADLRVQQYPGPSA